MPYTDNAWAAINDLGARIDQRLVDADVRLTVGGEPTFVSADNLVDPEWRVAADGPHKRERASVLAAGLKSVWAPQGLVQRNLGKWYPGEDLPRWQIGLHWRRDGLPLWSDETLLADPWATDATRPDVDPTLPSRFCRSSPKDWASRSRRCGPPTKTRWADSRKAFGCPQVRVWSRVTIWSSTGRRSRGICLRGLTNR